MKNPSKKSVKTVEKYIKSLQSTLKLSDWDIKIEKDTAKDCWAQIDRADNQKRAIMGLGKLFWKASLDEQVHTLVHEMCHCHLFDINSTVEETCMAVDEETGRVISIVVNRQVEAATDAFADALLPLVPKPEKRFEP